MLCGSDSHQIIHTEIREKASNVMMCNDCSFIFLQDYQAIDYSSSYGGLALSNEWSNQDALIKRSESLKRFNRIVADLILDKNNCNVLEIYSAPTNQDNNLKFLISNELNLTKQFGVKNYE